MKTVIIVNGRPRAGKDTVVAMMSNLLTGSRIPTASFSSIDPVKHMLRMAGFYLEGKTPEDRALLAEIGDSVERHSRWRTTKTLWQVDDFFEKTGDGPAVMFLHIREKLLIDRLQQQFTARGWKTLKFVVVSKRAENVTSNAADMNVGDIDYDDLIRNDGTLDELAAACDIALFRNGTIPQRTLLPT